MNPQYDTQAPPSPEEEMQGTASVPGGFNPGELLADSALAVFNNLLAIGGGWFVKIKKHDKFYDLDEFVKLIDDQNEANVRRLLLDEDDKAMLRPLLAAMLAKQAQTIGPEQQLIAVAFSILMRKLQLIMAIRKENQQMEKRLVELIETHNSPSPVATKQQAPEVPTQPASPEPQTQVAGLIPEPTTELIPEFALDIEAEAVEMATAQPLPSTQELVQEAPNEDLPQAPQAQVEQEPETAPIDPQTNSNPEPDMQVTFSPETSKYENRIAQAFAQVGKHADTNPKTLFLRMSTESGDLEGIWFKDSLPYQHLVFKDILKMVFGSASTFIPGIGSLAKTKIKGFMAAKAEKYGLAPQGCSLFMAYNQDRIVAKIIGNGAVQEVLSIDQLVEQFQNGGVENAA